jgi:hypothetical protein
MTDTNQKSTTGILSYMILILVILVILITFFYSVFEIWKSKADTNICRQSVDLHAGMHIEGLNPYEDLKCPPKYETISNDKDEEVKKEIADMMAECFWKFGGDDKLELFGGSGTYCALCNHITFEGSAYNSKINGFRTFLAEELVPMKYANGLSYAQYFMGRKMTTKEVQNLNTADPGIDTNKEYGVMFVYDKDVELSKFWTTLISGGGTTVVTIAGGLYLLPFSMAGLGVIAVVSMATGVAGGAVGYDLGSEEPVKHQHGVILIPYDSEEIKKLKCTQMPVKQGNK